MTPKPTVYMKTEFVMTTTRILATALMTPATAAGALVSGVVGEFLPPRHPITGPG